MESWNYTSNMAPAWCIAGADLAKFDGERAKRCAPILRDAIVDMQRRPEFYTLYNPKNGWGSMKTLVPALQKLLSAMEEHPEAMVRVSR